MWHYLPRADDRNAYWDVSTGEPVTIAEHGSHCEHPHSTWFSAMDLRASNMQVWNGSCCTACGRILTIAKQE